MFAIPYGTFSGKMTYVLHDFRLHTFARLFSRYMPTFARLYLGPRMGWTSRNFAKVCQCQYFTHTDYNSSRVLCLIYFQELQVYVAVDNDKVFQFADCTLKTYIEPVCTVSTSYLDMFYHLHPYIYIYDFNKKT